MKITKLMFTFIAFLILACGGLNLSGKPSKEPQAENPNEETESAPTPEESGAAVASVVISSGVDMVIASTNVGSYIPGGVAMVIDNGEIIHKNAYGLADVENSIPTTTDNVFHLASVSKQFTALGIMMLAERGELDYDDSIAKHIPELAWMNNEVTIRRLLHHTSGIPDYYENDSLIDRLMEISEQPSNEDVLTLLSGESEMMFEPGEKFLYSNTGYDVLGALIERKSEQTYADFMQVNIFGPLGMKDTFAMPSPEKLNASNVSLSYWLEDGQPSAYEPDPLDNLNGSGSTYSSLNDMYLYDQALYTDKIVKPSTLAEAFAPAALNNSESTEYGFAWDVGDYEGEPYVGHSGSWLGFVSYFLRFPERKLSIVLMFNLDELNPDTETLAFQIADLYLK